MGVETSDIYVLPSAEAGWMTGDSQSELVDRFDRALTSRVPGNVFSYSQPIELRVQELIAGIRSQLAVTLYGEDLATLRSVAEEIARVTSEVPGAEEV